MAVAACGSDGSSGAPSPTPAATRTPAPLAGIDIAPTLLLDPGTLTSAYATGVNARGWISIEYVQGDGPMIVLVPESGSGAGEAPVPGCPVGAGAPSCARLDAEALMVGDSDWYVGALPEAIGSALWWIPAAFGPAGEVVELAPCCEGFEASDVRPFPGPRVLGATTVAGPTSPPTSPQLRVRVPVLWRAGRSDHETLPIDGVPFGASANGADANGRIAGEGLPQGGQNTPVVPVVWEPRGATYAIARLPLLDGASAGSALAIDTGQIVGWSGSGSGRMPVVWEESEDGWTVRALPVPEDLRDCGAVATSGARVAGNCSLANLDGRGLVWRHDGNAWIVEARLLPYPGVDSAFVRAMSGDLVVGDAHDQGGFGTVDGPMAWRLPASEGAP